MTLNPAGLAAPVQCSGEPTVGPRRGAATCLVACVLAIILASCSGGSGDLRALRAKANAAFSLGKCHQAIPLLEKLASADPLDAVALLNEGGCYMQEADYSAAISVTERAVSLSPSSNTLTQLAEAEWAEGLDTRAVADLKRSSEYLHIADQFITVAQLLQSYLDSPDAEAVLQKVAPPQRNYLWYDTAGKVDLDLNNYAEAIPNFNQALQLAPPNVQGSVIVDLGDAYWTRDDCADAVPEYTKALIPTVFSQAYVHDQIGLCQERLGQLSDARTSFQLALHSQPSPDQVGTFDLNLLQVDLMQKDQSAARALNTIMQSTASIPSSIRSQASSLLVAANVTAQVNPACPQVAHHS